MRSNSHLSNPCKGATYIFLHIELLFVTGFASLVPEFRWYGCNNASIFVDGSPYSGNFNMVLDYLLHNVSQTGFNTTSYGQPPNMVFGFVQCVGNMTAEDCSSCSQQAKTYVELYCENDIGGEVLMDYCFLRYDNTNFISVLDTSGYYIPNPQDVQGDQKAFASTTFNFLSDLCKKAYNPASKGFASASIKYNYTVQLYGLAQCWRDISAEDCRKCLSRAIITIQNCCSKRQGAHVLFGSCTLRFEIYPFFNFSGSPSSEGSTPSIVAVTPSGNGESAHGSTPPPVAHATPSKKSSKSLALILWIVGAVILLSLLCLLGMRNTVKSAIFRTPVTLVTQNEGLQDVEEPVLLQRRQNFIFRLETLLEATENFHDKNKLGEGGFGAVYKGTTRDGKVMAVKKLSARSGQGKREFTNEVKLVANIQHRSLVKLLGCCVEGSERLLVYEYFPNKSLDNFLFDSEKRKMLDWRKRYNIIVGIARGLLYLHEDSQLRIIHRDIKANNILLDDKLYPKISDFGLARLFPDDQTHIQTRIAGTYGYMPPEYAMRGELSVKVDVYGFGVLLLELVSARRNADVNLPYESQSLLEWAWRLYKGGHVLDMIDSVLTENFSEKQVLRCIQVGLLCTQADAALRPLMSNVVMMISNNSVTVPDPTRPAFVNISHRCASSLSSTGFEECERSSSLSTSNRCRLPSINEISTSEVEPP